MSKEKDKDQEIKDWNNGDKEIKEHQAKEGRTSFSQYVEDVAFGGDFSEGNL